MPALPLLSYRARAVPAASSKERSRSAGVEIGARSQNSRTKPPGYVRHAELLAAGPDAYDTCGFRGPAVLVSLDARPDCVLSEISDHTSVLKLIAETRTPPALTRRDTVATAPLGALDLMSAPAFLTPPELSEPALKWCIR